MLLRNGQFFGAHTVGQSLAGATLKKHGLSLKAGDPEGAAAGVM